MLERMATTLLRHNNWRKQAISPTTRKQAGPGKVVGETAIFHSWRLHGLEPLHEERIPSLAGLVFGLISWNSRPDKSDGDSVSRQTVEKGLFPSAQFFAAYGYFPVQFGGAFKKHPSPNKNEKNP
jgi:hypothetical protein